MQNCDRTYVVAIFVAGFLPPMLSMSTEILAGRLAAVCVHPLAAWRVMPWSGRLVLAGAYFGATYLVALAILMIV